MNKSNTIDFDFQHNLTLCEIKNAQFKTRKVPVTVAGEAFEYLHPELPALKKYYARITSVLYGPDSTNILDVVKALGGLDRLQEAADKHAECVFLERRVREAIKDMKPPSIPQGIRLTIIGPTQFPGVLMADEAGELLEATYHAIRNLMSSRPGKKEEAA